MTEQVLHRQFRNFHDWTATGFHPRNHVAAQTQTMRQFRLGELKFLAFVAELLRGHLFFFLKRVVFRISPSLEQLRHSCTVAALELNQVASMPKRAANQRAKFNLPFVRVFTDGIVLAPDLQCVFLRHVRSLLLNSDHGNNIELLYSHVKSYSTLFFGTWLEACDFVRWLLYRELRRDV